MTHPRLKQWLLNQELIQADDADDECILRRVITATGKSRAWINGSPCNLKMMRELGEQLVDIHGQHEHQSLMKKNMQRTMLDDFAGNQTLLKKVSEAYSNWCELNNKLQLLSTQNSDHQAKLDLFVFKHKN